MAEVLVVDDDAEIAVLLQAVLEDEGFHVTLARNGEVALSRVREMRFNVIVLDLSMPVMDGRTFYRELRALPDPTPVLLLSAHDPVSAQSELGADDALAKPFDMDELTHHVHRLAVARYRSE